MVEPILPSVGIAITAITFLLFIRNAIEKITKDYSDIKDDHWVLIPLALDLILLEDKLEAWRRLWHIPEDGPEEISSNLWGDEGAGLIRVTLEDIQIKLEKLLKTFKKRYANEKFADQLAKLEATKYRTRMQIQKELREVFAHYKQSLAKRIGTALIYQPIFTDQIKGLLELLAKLENISIIRFIEAARGGHENDWKDHVSPVVFRTHLESLSRTTATGSDTLRTSILESASLTADFLLNHGREPDERLECLESFTSNRTIAHHFYLSKKGKAITTYPMLCCRPSQVKKKTTVSGENVPLADLLHGFQAQHSPKDTVIYYDLSSGTQFSFDYQGSSTLSSSCLRSILSQEKLRQTLSQAERKQLSYELAECALLFLRTRWFSELCTCALRRNVVQQDLSTTFTFRIGNVQHIHPDDHEEHPPWCTQELKGMHIRRIGVLLTELCLGKLAFDVRMSHSFDAVEIDFTKDPLESSFTPLEDVLREVEIEVSDDFKEAVRHCLLQETSPEAITRDQIEEFHDDVVEP